MERGVRKWQKVCLEWDMIKFFIQAVPSPGAFQNTNPFLVYARGKLRIGRRIWGWVRNIRLYSCTIMWFSRRRV